VSELLGPGVRLDHVSVAAEELEHPLVRLAGFEATLERPMPSGVRVARFGPLELVAPERAGSPVERFLAGRGPGLHHVALGVADPLERVTERLAQAGVETLGRIEPGSDGRRTLFLHPRTMGGVLVELVEGAPA
jgi:methylmalonyl-CoA/ethylmalonyl-CoA epimerase